MRNVTLTAKESAVKSHQRGFVDNFFELRTSQSNENYQEIGDRNDFSKNIPESKIQKDVERRLVQSNIPRIIMNYKDIRLYLYLTYQKIVRRIEKNCHY